MPNLMIKEFDSGVIFTAKIIADSSKTAICGFHNEMLKIKVSVPPERGRANQCLLDFLSTELGIKKKAISIVSGKNNPVKRVQILDMSAETLLEKLNQIEPRL